MRAALQRFGKLDRRAQRGRHQRAHAARAQLDHFVRHRFEVGAAEQHRGVEAVAFGRDRGELPIANVRGKDQRGLAVIAKLLHQPLAVVGAHDAPALVIHRIVVPQSVDMGELGADAAEVLPDAAQNALDLVRRLLRKGRNEVGASQAMLRQPGPDGPDDAAGDVRHGVGWTKAAPHAAYAR